MIEADKLTIRDCNNAIIAGKDYRFNSWLPILEDPNVRTLAEVRARMSIMNAMINISFEAPIAFIRSWIDAHSLKPYLSTWENEILAKDNDDLTERELISLRWYLEGLWALMWATKLIDTLDETQWCGDNMATLLPNLEQQEDNSKIDSLDSLQTDVDIYNMLDLYYRLHWYCVDERLNGREAKINEGIVYERRKALEWLINKDSVWDDIEMST